MHDSSIDHRSEWIPSPRRVRVLFNNETVAGSDEMMLLRQHGFLPVYYFPLAHVRTDLLEKSPHSTFSPYKGVATYFDVRVADRLSPASAWTYEAPLPGSPDTRGYVSFHWHAMDAWLEEDEPVFVHARDPYVRAETLSSSRHVVVRLQGEIAAKTSRPVLLLETGLVTRYYIPRADVRRELFEESSTYSKCPYKGTASYLSYRHGDVHVDDAAWYYRSPLPDVRKIAGLVSFWNERPETTIEVDGEILPRLGVRRNAGGGELLYPSRRFFAVPPPATMAGAPPGRLQHDFARPNGRAEGPPDELIDMGVERAGRRRSSATRAIDPSSEVTVTDSAGSSDRTSRFFTFCASPPGAPLTGAAPSFGEEEPIDLAPGRICERALRRVRAVVAGVTVADSGDAILYVGDDDVPIYYFPTGDVRAATVSIVGPPPDVDVLRGRVALAWDSIDAWFEEDDEVRGSPRLPYHRVDALHSSRHVVVTLAGRRLAESRRNVALFETGKPARYYISRLDTEGCLIPSGRTGESAYLGTASYLSAVIDGTMFADVAWTFRFPVPECPRIAGLISFDEAATRVEIC